MSPRINRNKRIPGFFTTTMVGVLLALPAIFAGTAQAADVQRNAAAAKTRSQVVAELHEALAQGLVSKNKLDYPVSAPVAPRKTREQVRAELDIAMATNQISRNKLDYPVQGQPAGALSRAEVVAQLVAYQDAHPYDSNVNRH